MRVVAGVGFLMESERNSAGHSLALEIKQHLRCESFRRIHARTKVVLDRVLDVAASGRRGIALGGGARLVDGVIHLDVFIGQTRSTRACIRELGLTEQGHTDKEAYRN